MRPGLCGCHPIASHTKPAKKTSAPVGRLPVPKRRRVVSRFAERTPGPGPACLMVPPPPQKGRPACWPPTWTTTLRGDPGPHRRGPDWPGAETRNTNPPARRRAKNRQSKVTGDRQRQMPTTGREQGSRAGGWPPIQGSAWIRSGECRDLFHCGGRYGEPGCARKKEDGGEAHGSNGEARRRNSRSFRQRRLGVPRMNALHPELMSPAERRAELCRILALGVIRLRMGENAQHSANNGEIPLHYEDEPSGTADANDRRTEYDRHHPCPLGRAEIHLDARAEDPGGNSSTASRRPSIGVSLRAASPTGSKNWPTAG